MPKLTDLEPELFRYESRIETYNTTAGQKTGPRVYLVPEASLSIAQCIMFLCPKCFSGQQHHVEVTFSGRGVSDEMGTHNKDGKPTRWNVSGSGFDDLTMQPSIQIQGGCNWHGLIINGEVD